MTAEKIIPRLARQRTLAQPIDVNRQIYRLAQGWQGSLLKEDPSIVQIDSVEALRTALADPQTATLLVLKASGLQAEELPALVDQFSLKKTIFIE